MRGRAYKLGKRRWSYNQCDIKFVQEGGLGKAEVMEAAQSSTPLLTEEQLESGVTYQVRPCPLVATLTCKVGQNSDIPSCLMQHLF